MKLRLDKLLVERGFAPTRERAQAIILAGRVLVDEQKVDKPGHGVPETAALRLLGGDLRYVSRGGLKLEAAVRHWHIDLAGRFCLDVGTSTGGFTDCMLQHGAARVLAVDTGYGQIADTLRRDPRVNLMERTNARNLGSGDLPPGINFLAMDVSFISATLVLPAVVNAIQSASSPLEMVVLVKPQFEAGRERVGKGGVVRDPAVRAAAVVAVADAAAALGWGARAVTTSPLPGPSGNVEFFVWLRRGPATVGAEEMGRVVSAGPAGATDERVKP